MWKSLQPELHALIFEKAASVRSLEHRKRGQSSCLRAGPSDDSDGSACIGYRPPGTGIEDMRVAVAVCKDEAARIATCCKAALAKPDEADCSTGRRCRFDPNAPGCAVLTRMARGDVAAEVDDAADIAELFLDQVCCRIDSVLLADTAEVDLHLRLYLQLGTTPTDLVHPAC